MEGGYRVYRRVGSRRELPKNRLEPTRSGAKTAAPAAETHAGKHERRSSAERGKERRRRKKREERKHGKKKEIKKREVKR